jgi:excisionase family DNA binding protein
MPDMAMKQLINDEPILTTEEVAVLLAVSKMTVRRWIESGVIQRDEWFRPGKDYRIYQRAVRRLRGEEPTAQAS